MIQKAEREICDRTERIEVSLLPINLYPKYKRDNIVKKWKIGKMKILNFSAKLVPNMNLTHQIL